MTNIITHFCAAPLRSCMATAVAATTLTQIGRSRSFDIANWVARMHIANWATLAATTTWTLNTLEKSHSWVAFLTSMPGGKWFYQRARVSGIYVGMAFVAITLASVYLTNKAADAYKTRFSPLNANNEDIDSLEPISTWATPLSVKVEQGFMLAQLISSLALIKFSQSSRFFIALSAMQAVGLVSLASWKWMQVKMVLTEDSQDSPSETLTLSFPLYRATTSTPLNSRSAGIVLYNTQGPESTSRTLDESSPILVVVPQDTTIERQAVIKGLLKSIPNASEAAKALRDLEINDISYLAIDGEQTQLSISSGSQVQKGAVLGTVKGECPICLSSEQDSTLYRICQTHNQCLSCFQTVLKNSQAQLQEEHNLGFYQQSDLPVATIKNGTINWVDATVSIVDTALPKCAECRDLSLLLDIGVEYDGHFFRGYPSTSFSAEVNILTESNEPGELVPLHPWSNRLRWLAWQCARAIVVYH